MLSAAGTKGDDTLRVGIIGCGSIARTRHAWEFSIDSRVEIAGFFDNHPERARSLADTYGGMVYPTVSAMLDDPSIDAVSVCTANSGHAPIAIEAMEKGKHVLCEKPMACTENECRDMLSVSKRTGKRLLIAQNERLQPGHVKVKEMLDEGKLGRILTFCAMNCHSGPEMWSSAKSCNTWFFRRDRAQFGSMADLGIHKIDLIRYLVGDEIESVYSKMCVMDKKFEDGSPIEVDDNSVEVLTFRNGVFGTVTTSWTCYGNWFDQATLFCENGIARLYTERGYSLVVTYRDGSEYRLEKTKEEEKNSGVISEFDTAVLTGRSSILDAERVAGSMAAVFASSRSSESGKEEKVIPL